jgi:hypothetical protein
MPRQQIALYLSAWLSTPQGKRLIFRQPADSILGNFLIPLYTQMANTGTYGTFRGTDGLYYTPGVGSYNFRLAASPTQDGIGLVVGLGSTTVALADYKLETQIMNGIAANQLQYGAQSYSMVGKGVPAWDWYITRLFTNNSPNSILVKESGLYAYVATSTGGQNLACIVRDVFTSVSVPIGKTLTMEYLIEIPLL